MLLFVIACLLLGSIVGVLAGMLGIGGGLIIVPVLSYLFTEHLAFDAYVAMPIAIATSLSTIIFTGMSSARAHYKLGNLDTSIVIWVALGIAFGATMGAQIASMLPAQQLTVVFAVLVLGVAAQMVFGKPKPSRFEAKPLLLVIVGLIAGILAAIMGIGGGALLVPALILLQVNIRIAIGCAALSGIVIAIFGTSSFIYAGWGQALPDSTLGYVYWPATLSIAATSVFTAGVGARIGQNLQTDKLKKVFAGLLVLISLKMIIGMT